MNLSLSELRVGNFIGVDGQIIPRKIISIPVQYGYPPEQIECGDGEPQIIVTNKAYARGQGVRISSVHSILISRDVLERDLEFEHDGANIFLSPPILNLYGARMKVHLPTHGICVFYLNNFSKVNFRGLHHLQNLYFDLYNEDLKVNIK